MLPSTANDALLKEIEIIEQPSTGYKLLMDRNRIAGTVDSLEAVAQAVFISLNTERYQYLIYSWNHGIELNDLYGQPVTYVIPELEERIKETLMQDNRITDVDTFEHDTSIRKVLYTTFVVHTIYGDIEANKEVEY